MDIDKYRSPVMALVEQVLQEAAQDRGQRHESPKTDPCWSELVDHLTALKSAKDDFRLALSAYNNITFMMAEEKEPPELPSLKLLGKALDNWRRALKRGW